MRIILLGLGIFLTIIILSGSSSCNDNITETKYVELFNVEGIQRISMGGYYTTVMTMENKHTGKRYMVVRGSDSVAICPE